MKKVGQHNIRYPRTVPGNSSYSDITWKGKKITIFGDSILQRMKGKEISKELKHGPAYVRSFPGANCNEMSHYVIPHLTERTPDAVVLHVGTNDVRTRRGQREKSNEQIANEIIAIGRTCKSFGVNDVFISSITYKKGFHIWRKFVR